MFKLSDNFYAAEVSKSYIAQRNGIDNTPPPEVLAHAKALAVNCLQPIRDHFGVPYTPQSWYRCEELEKLVTKNSYPKWLRKKGLSDSEENWALYFSLKSHPEGEACDIEVPGVANDDLFGWCADNLEFDQLIRECAVPGDPTSGWVHISFREGNNRREVFSL